MRCAEGSVDTVEEKPGGREGGVHWLYEGSTAGRDRQGRRCWPMGHLDLKRRAGGEGTNERDEGWIREAISCKAGGRNFSTGGREATCQAVLKI